MGANHNGGYYVYDNYLQASKADIKRNLSNLFYDKKLYVLKCYCSGSCLKYDLGKIAFENITPVDVDTIFKSNEYLPKIKYIYCDKQNHFTYKQVSIINGKYYDIFNSKIEYIFGKSQYN